MRWQRSSVRGCWQAGGNKVYRCIHTTNTTQMQFLQVQLVTLEESQKIQAASSCQSFNMSLTFLLQLELWNPN